MDVGTKEKGLAVYPDGREGKMTSKLVLVLTLKSRPN